MSRRTFASDNAAGVHPRVLAAIAAANEGHALAYGNDPWTARAEAELRRHFGEQARAYLLWGGTGANVVALASVLRPWQAVLCASSSHLWNDECAAPERFLGAKLVPVPADAAGKLTPAALAPFVAGGRSVHGARPRVVSVANATEWGTVYTPEELRTLADWAHAHGLLLHVDGARLCNAAAALGVTLGALSTEAGVDLLGFGGTKNGLLAAEAVLLLDPALDEDTGRCRKQAMQLPSKMRFLAAQMLAMLEGDLWRECAAHANAMAARLARGVADAPGLELAAPVESNAVFARLPRGALADLQSERAFHLWDEASSVVRWMTAFDTTEADVDDFARAVHARLR